MTVQAGGVSRLALLCTSLPRLSLVGSAEFVMFYAIAMRYAQSGFLCHTAWFSPRLLGPGVAQGVVQESAALQGLA